MGFFLGMLQIVCADGVHVFHGKVTLCRFLGVVLVVEQYKTLFFLVFADVLHFVVDHEFVFVSAKRFSVVEA